MSGESERVEYLLNCWSHLQLAREYEKLENIIKEVREYIEKHRHKSSESFIQTCENFIKEQEYLLSILDKKNK